MLEVESIYICTITLLKYMVNGEYLLSFDM